MDEKMEIVLNFGEAVTIHHERVLGRGNFGEVKEGVIYGEKVAVKIIFNQGTEVTEEAKRELNTMKKLRHRNIVKLIGIIDEDFSCEPKLVFEFVENGSLAKFVSSESRDENTLIRLCYDIVCGMAYLHSKNYIHRDLAARNVLVDGNHRAKVADFGLSRVINFCPENYYYLLDGTKQLPVRWSPKETIQAIVSLGSELGKFSFASDVWSYGVTMWEIWSGGKIPYRIKGKSIPNTNVINYINDGKNPNTFDVPENAPGEILTIMDEIFQVDRKLRPTFSELKEKFENNYDSNLLSEGKDDQVDSHMNSIRRKLSLAYNNTQWWPAKKMLVQALQRRKIGDTLLIEKLHEIILNNNRRMTVICQSESATKFSGIGGVGKTLTAKWYANHYEKEYQHIIWINSEEDSLFKSFKYLARDLGVKNRNEIDDLARGCYANLSKFKCLWIFDNVVVNDEMHSVLPINYRKFHCLITTRCRDNWGKDNGYGEISKLEIGVFDEIESIEFLQTYLHPQISYTEYQLRQLSKQLGNLPLALQLAVATLNDRKIDLQNYIDQISTTYDFNIIEEKFDDYEKTINKNTLISLNLIQKEPKGSLASKVFMIFGYIRPDDIQFEFLRRVSGVNIHDLQSSIDILLKYSLITKSGMEKCMSPQGVMGKVFGRSRIEVERDVLSIHRLLQQVIRHNGKLSENETIRRILSCKGYIDYKLIPYLHASDSLKFQFQDIRTKLIDQVYLQTLVTSKRFQEALELSKFIHLEVKNNASLYNYAICLDLKGEHTEAVSIFNQLRGILLESDTESENKFGFQTGIIPVTSEPSKLHIQYSLLNDSFRSRKIRTEILNIDPIENEITLSLDFGDLKGIVQSLESCSIECYSLQSTGANITLQINSDVGKPLTKKMLFTGCSLNKDIELPKDLKRLSLNNVKIMDENSEELKNDFSHFMTSNIEQLYVMHSESSLPWNAFVAMNHVDVRNCKIILPANPTRISPKILRLEAVKIYQQGNKIDEININDLIAFKKLQKLHLCANKKSTKFIIDLKEALIVKEVKLLDNIKVADWDEANWQIEMLTVRNLSLVQKNNLKISELETNYTVDVGCISQSIKKIKMQEGAELKNTMGKTMELPKLKVLHLVDIPHPSPTLGLFHACNNLKKIKLELHTTFMIRVKLKCIPHSVTVIEINSNYKDVSVDFVSVGQYKRPLDILIVDNVGLKFIYDILEKLKPNELVILSKESEESVNELMLSLKSNVVPTILISTNRQYYYFKSNKRQMVSKMEFDDMFCKYFS